MSCVRPGVLLTNARRLRPASALIALDLPAFERPAKAISGTPGAGSSRGSCAESKYAARRKASAPDAFLARERFAELESAGLLPFPTRPFPRGPRMRAVTGFAGLMALVYAGAAAAAAPASMPKPDLERGKQIASAVCAACHGADGNSGGATNPILAGPHTDYIAAQLAAFKAAASAAAASPARGSPQPCGSCLRASPHRAPRPPVAAASRDRCRARERG